MTPCTKDLQVFTDRICLLSENYKSFVNAKGVRRIKAIEWAANEISKSALYEETNPESLLQRIGWNTFIGFGLYSGIIGLISPLSKESQSLERFSYSIQLLLDDILKYTDIGYLISISVEVEKSEQIKFARIDKSGNVFIFPDDVDELLSEIESLIC